MDKAAQETTEESEFRKQQTMQAELKQMVNRNQVAMERSRRTAYSGNVRSSKPLTVSRVSRRSIIIFCCCRLSVVVRFASFCAPSSLPPPRSKFTLQRLL